MKTINQVVLSTLVLSVGLVSTTSAQTTTFTSTSWGSFGPIVAPDSLASGFGTNLAATTTPATLPLQTTLGNVQVSITDSSGAQLDAQLYMVSAGQINYVVPANAALGRATVSVSSGSTTFTGVLYISNIAPSIATANGNGQGVPAAQVLRVTSGGTSTIVPTFTAGSGTGSSYVPTMIDLTTSPTDKLYLMLYGSGIRRHSLNPVEASIAGVKIPVLYAGAQSQYPGLDQVNLGPLPSSLAGKGQVDLLLSADGVPANVVSIAFQ